MYLNTKMLVLLTLCIKNKREMVNLSPCMDINKNRPHAFPNTEVALVNTSTITLTGKGTNGLSGR